ncbi:MAG: hypothetical protein RL100_779 [Actinomycetota bacterium]|jgi:preprotein translocase subunit YajC
MNADLFLVAALAVLIAMMFFNSRKRKKQMQELQDSLKVGTNVILHSGITGTLVSIDEKRAVLETTPGTKISVVKGAIRGIDTDAPAKPAAKSAAKPAAAKPAAKKPAAKKPAAK